MAVTRPSKNKLTQGYKNYHKGYDFSGKGDLNAYACLDCKCIESVNRYVNNWTSTPPLTIRDYGNYAKFLHTDGTYSLYAHLEKDSVPQVGDVFAEGSVVAHIGNTGNSNGRHLHFEFIDKNNHNQKIEFKEVSMPSDDGIKELQVKLNKLEEEYKLEQQRVVDCRNDRTSLQTQIDNLKVEMEKQRDDLNVRIAAAEAGQQAEKEASKEKDRWLSLTLGTSQNWPDIKKAITGLVGVEDLLNKERKAHSDTKGELDDAKKQIGALEAEIERLEGELKKAKGLSDASTIELTIEIYERIIARLRNIVRR